MSKEEKSYLWTLAWYHPTTSQCTCRYREYTTDRLGVMAQKAEKMLLKIMNE